MYQDGTRRFSEAMGGGNDLYLKMQYRRDRDGWESIGIAIEPPGYNDGGDGFLHYDGTISGLDNPPNQHYQLQNFRAHAARFAHQLDAAMGHHTLQRAEE